MHTTPRTLFEKIWDEHIVVQRDDGPTLLYIDRHLVIDPSFHSFNRLRAKGLPVRRPALSLATVDHYIPTRRQAKAVTADLTGEPAAMRVLHDFTSNTAQFGLPTFDAGDPRQGIAHVVGPEQAFTLPGTTLVCGDSHTSTHGALGSYAFGVGASEVGHVLATQALWLLRPKTMRIEVKGALAPGVSAKDLALFIIAQVGPAGAVGHVIEYGGQAIEALSIEQRCTLCNMSIEMGARAGLVAPDDTTFSYLRDKPLAPRGGDWEQAAAYWRTLATDPGASFDRTVVIDATRIAPMVTWGTSPEQAIAIDAPIPDPRDLADPQLQERALAALRYMDIAPGQAMSSVPIDQVFIGSCTNGRLEDLRDAAEVVRRLGGRARLPVLVTPGSSTVKQQAEAEGLDAVFLAAGFEWRESGCSMCVGNNGDWVPPGKRCVSTSNRNFPGRQGPDSKTHLVSPATAAATAMRGYLSSAGTGQ